MKKTILCLLGVFIFVNCGIGIGYDYDIGYMSSKELTYDELPTKMQECLTNPKLDSLFKRDLIYIFDKEYDRYQVEGVPFGPWILYNKLIDSKKGIVYRIEQGRALPYIIYNEKLYIASRFNYHLDEYLRETTFSEYKLK